MEFRFVREGDTFTWQNDSYKLEFTEPHIQPWHDESKKIYSADEILYYYYTLTVSERDGAGWRSVSSADAYDFPAIFRLLDLVDYMLEAEPEVSDKYDTPNSSGVFEQECDTNYWLREDYYSIKAFADVCSQLHYEVYAGSEHRGIRAVVNEWELYELKKCAEAFVQYSIDNSNEFSEKRNTADCESHRAVNGMLYEYHVSCCKETVSFKVDYSRIEDIFMAEDRLKNITVLVREGDHFHSECYEDKTIAGITDKEMFFTDGSFVPLDSILYLFRAISKEEYAYDMYQVTEDFFSRLCDAQKQDFITLSEDELYNKYHNVITDRTAMFREEHHFPMLIETEDHHENICEVVRYIIREIKSKLTEN